MWRDRLERCVVGQVSARYSENDKCGGTGWRGVWCAVRMTSVAGQVGQVQ